MHSDSVLLGTCWLSLLMAVTIKSGVTSSEMLEKAKSALQRLPAVARWRTRQATARLDTAGPIECALEGKALLNTPIFNKGIYEQLCWHNEMDSDLESFYLGTAFPIKERIAFGIDGLLPSEPQSLEARALSTH